MATVDDVLLRVEDLCVDITTDRGQLRAVDGVSFTVGAGEVVGLVGESGSGKTMSAKAIMGLLGDPRTYRVEGRALFKGRDLLAMSPRELRELRGTQLGMIFQDPIAHLDPAFRVGTAITEPLQVHYGMSGSAAAEEAVRMLELLRIPGPAAVMRAFPSQISGGMAQRVMIASVLASKPALVIADECTSGLDMTVQASILRLLEDMRERLGMTLLLTTHDLRVARALCSRLLVLYGGRPMELGAAGAVLADPLHPYSEALLASDPSQAGAGRLKPIPGEAPVLGRRADACPFAPRCPRSQPVCVEAAPPFEPVEAGRLSACHFATDLLEERRTAHAAGG